MNAATRADGSANAASLRSRALFMHSLNPMLIADDERRYVDANAAACLFLRQSQEAIRRLRIDDLTQPALRAGLDEMWSQFLERRLGPSEIAWDLRLPDGATIAVDLASTPHFEPGRHLAIILFPAARELNERLGQTPAPASVVLSKREREVLTLVALGNTGVEIARQLCLAPATVQSHVANALVKLRAKNRAHGIMLALQTGELDLDTGLDQPARFITSPSGSADARRR